MYSQTKRKAATNENQSAAQYPYAVAYKCTCISYDFSMFVFSSPLYNCTMHISQSSMARVAVYNTICTTSKSRNLWTIQSSLLLCSTLIFYCVLHCFLLSSFYSLDRRVLYTHSFILTVEKPLFAHISLFIFLSLHFILKYAP